jgi:polyisoprenoid-binding protein YceI
MSASVVFSGPTSELIPAGTWEVDPNRSSVGFQVKHTVISTVNGRFPVVAGALEVGEGRTLHAHGMVQVASIDTHQRKRDGHLRSTDFLDALSNPQMRFASTEITPAGDTNLRITAELTIKGQTRPVELTAEVGDIRGVPWGDDRISLIARRELTRKVFGLTKRKKLEAGGALVSDRVKVEANTTLVRSVKSARMADVSLLALRGATVYRGSRTAAKPAQKMAKRWAMEPASSSAPTPADGGAEE